MTLTSSHPFMITGGQNVDLFPATSELTIAQAAALLKMSEACIQELLDSDRLGYRQEGNQRFIDGNTFFEFKQRYDRTNAAVDEMVCMNQEMGLYDD
jgi:hypothetical protein